MAKKEKETQLILADGNSGLAVRQMQRRLKDLRYLAEENGGQYDALTTAAVAAFQSANNLPMTGVADPKTLEVLYGDYCLSAGTLAGETMNGTTTDEAPAATDAIATVQAEPVALPDPQVTIPLAQAKQLYELYRNVEFADAHFRACQSQNFRIHVQGVYMAGKIEKAFAALAAAISAEEP